MRSQSKPPRMVETLAIGVDMHVHERRSATDITHAGRTERELAQMLEIRRQVDTLERRVEERLVTE